MSLNHISHLQTTRRYLLTTLLNLPIVTTETSVASLLSLIEHYSENPDEYLELINGQHNTINE